MTFSWKPSNYQFSFYPILPLSHRRLMGYWVTWTVCECNNSRRTSSRISNLIPYVRLPKCWGVAQYFVYFYMHLCRCRLKCPAWPHLAMVKNPSKKIPSSRSGLTLRVSQAWPTLKVCNLNKSINLCGRGCLSPCSLFIYNLLCSFYRSKPWSWTPTCSGLVKVRSSSELVFWLIWRRSET